MEIDKTRNKPFENDSINLFHNDEYYSTYSNYNKFNYNKKKVKKVDKGTSTMDFNINSSSSNINILKSFKTNQNNKINKINKILYEERTKYKILYKQKNKKSINYKHLNDNYINNILNPYNDKNLPLLSNRINSSKRIQIKKKKFNEFTERSFKIKKITNFNEKLDAIDLTPSIKFNFNRLKLLMQKQNDKNFKIINDVQKEMIKSKDLLKIYCNKLNHKSISYQINKY